MWPLLSHVVRKSDILIRKRLNTFALSQKSNNRTYLLTHTYYLLIEEYKFTETSN